ncbi:MAG: DUF1189 family protein [Alphaproteobacteria bacterium]|nr:DUF1189 family protein [Alphaproteobacteria bacterium]
MNKIFNYISSGTGFGIKFILIISLIASITTTLNLRDNARIAIPYAQQAADKLLPVTISNNTITNPTDTFRDATLVLGTSNEQPLLLPIILNTTVDSLDATRLPAGIYLTRKYIYTVNDNQIRTTQYPESLKLEKQDYTKTFSDFLNQMAVYVWIFCAIGLFVFCFLSTIVFSFTAWLLSLLFRKPINFDSRMRLSTLCLFVIYMLAFFANTLGVAIPGFGLFIIMIIAQGILIHILPIKSTEA